MIKTLVFQTLGRVNQIVEQNKSYKSDYLIHDQIVFNIFQRTTILQGLKAFRPNKEYGLKL